NAFPSQTALPGGADQENRFHIKIDWSDFEGYFARLRQQGTSVNVAPYVGAGQVRRCAMGSDMRTPTDEEVRRMQAFVEQAMRQERSGFPAASFTRPTATTALRTWSPWPRSR